MARLDTKRKGPHDFLGQPDQLLIEGNIFLGGKHLHEVGSRLGQYVGTRSLIVPEDQLLLSFGKGHALSPFAAEFNRLAYADGDFGFAKARMRPLPLLSFPRRAGDTQSPRSKSARQLG